MISIIRAISPILFSAVGRFGFVIAFLAFSRFGRRVWHWFWA